MPLPSESLSLEDYKLGKVNCAYCNLPIYDPKKAMHHRPTDKLYHEEPCFEKALMEQLEQRGLDTKSMPPGITGIVRELFGISSGPQKKR
jgi:hypothetical protein